MRLATFNILHGRSLDDGVVDHDRLRAAVRALDADVLGLQEVDRDQPRSHGGDLTAIAAQAMGAREHRFAAAIHGTPGGTWTAAADGEQPAGAAYGVALLSRLPVRSWHVVRLAALPVRVPLRPPQQRWVLVRDEPRVGLAAVVETGHGPVTVATTHLSFLPGWNVVQLRLLLHRLAGLPRPQVLMGDLNLPGRLPRVVSRWQSLVCTPTFPSPQPRVQLDHILVRPPPPPAALPSARGSAPPAPLSDHRPLVADVEL